MIFKGLFSAGAWAIPAMLVIHAIFYADDLERGRIPSRVIFSVVTTVMISMIEYAIAFSAGQANGNPVDYFVEQRAGGFIGSALAFLMVKIFAWWGLIIIAVAVFAIYVAYFYAGSNSTIGKVFFTVLEYIARFLAVIERWIIDLVGICKDAINEKRQRQIEDKHAELIDDDFFEVDNGMATLEIKELFKMLPYIVTLVVLILTSIRNKRENHRKRKRSRLVSGCRQYWLHRTWSSVW